MMRTRAFLGRIGLPDRDLGGLPSSPRRFADGAHYRIEIPSTEGPACLEAVISEAERLDVAVHRVSQGSGVLMLTDAELDRMADLGRQAAIEISLFARPNAGWINSAMARSPAGAVMAPTAHGAEGLVAVMEDVLRAADHGIRSVLLADIGALYLFREMRSSGELPANMQAKVSVMLPAANPAAARVLVTLGASTLNVPTDLGLAQLAALRAATDIPLDVYVEAPDDLGGFVRLSEIAEIVRVAAPVYIKFGLRNAPNIYPAGGHLEAMAVACSRERVRRARIGLDLLARDPSLVISARGPDDLAVPRATAIDVSVTPAAVSPTTS
jgi:hypothetical protein